MLSCGKFKSLYQLTDHVISMAVSVSMKQAPRREGKDMALSLFKLVVHFVRAESPVVECVLQYSVLFRQTCPNHITSCCFRDFEGPAPLTLEYSSPVYLSKVLIKYEIVCRRIVKHIRLTIYKLEK